MKYKNILKIKNRNEFREWLNKNSELEKECYVLLKRGKPKDDKFYYLDAVEEALCFGWIDSTVSKIDGLVYQRFSPRSKNSPWTELNKERVRRLLKLGLMDKRGLEVLPPLGPRSFKINPKIEEALKAAKAYSKFKKFPPLYQRVRAYNVAYYINKDITLYEKSLNRLILMSKKNLMYGEWNDYGRLLNY